ncbi:MAG: substrate-binding domain-containing protein [Planctomycetota bacterium]|nr:substrate-binding domain-containing protein [Planctomycetota bacterium]MSR39066.1 ABC transporter permease [Planctomycetota bacterium]
MRERSLALCILLLFLALCFAFFAPNFGSLNNLLEIVRSATELGLLSLAMTLLMQAGALDLSVGAVMGLTAVMLGACLPAGLPLALLAALTTATVCGTTNGLLVARLRIPPLLATLATMALFRGIAEGSTRGYAVFTELPAAFLFCGQGYLLHVPAQLPLLVLASIGAFLLAHRTPFGRRLTALGNSPTAARYMGIDVARHQFTAHVLTGLSAGIAGILYTAHLGQAKADAGTGYELAAITVVVLGGTSLTGGKATIIGTLLALFCLATLQNGLLLAGLPSELGLILQGALLLLAVGIGRNHSTALSTTALPTDLRPFKMKNSQVLVLAAAILIAAAIIAFTNLALVRAIGGAAPALSPAHRVTVALMPKNKSDPYFASCQEGAQAAAAELDIDLIWDGPNDTDAARQNEIVEAWITKGVDVIGVSVESEAAISTVLRKARARGIKVLTFDADAAADARDFFVNQATEQAIAQALTDDAARILGGKGTFAIISASVTAANQNAWLKHIQLRLAEKWPELKLATTRYSDGLRDKAMAETNKLLRAFPDVQLVMVLAAAAVPGAAEAIKQAGSKVKLIGLSVPSLCRDYVHEGIIESITLWNTVDLGYLTVHTANAAARGLLKKGATTLSAGRMGTMTVQGDQVLLGAPFRFTKDNIDQFKF